jgi:hypothetical protein
MTVSGCVIPAKAGIDHQRWGEAGMTSDGKVSDGPRLEFTLDHDRGPG